MIARLDGRDLKGSDFLFRACTRAWQREPRALFPATLAAASDAQLADLFRADDGRQPLPMWSEHLALIRGQVAWFAAQRLAPADVIAEGHEIPIARVVAMHEGKRRKRATES